MRFQRFRLYVLTSLAIILTLFSSQAALAQSRVRSKVEPPAGGFREGDKITAPSAPAPAQYVDVPPTSKVSMFGTSATVAAKSAPQSSTQKGGGRGWVATGPRVVYVPPASLIAAPGELLISEFRWRGPNGANDEFIEIYNNTTTDHTVQTTDASAGYAVATASSNTLNNGIVTTRFIIPNGTIIPARGHFLGCNSVGYSLVNYPGGNGTNTMCNATYTSDIVENTGIAIFNTATAANFTIANRLDAVGATAETNTLYKEGTGVRNITPFAIDASYVRRLPGGCIGFDPGTVDANCTTNVLAANTPKASSSYQQDTDVNRDDFIFVDTNGTPASPEGTQQRLGAPGPENLSSPVIRGLIYGAPLDACVALSAAPNRVRDGGAFCGPPNPVVPPCDPANESTFGTLSFRRRFTNVTGGDVTRLRFRIVDITTFPTPGTNCSTTPINCIADLRARTSTMSVVAISPACGGGTANVEGTTLEESAVNQQPNGGAWNSTLSAGTITLAAPLANGASINVQLLLGVQQMGTFRFFVNLEALP